MRAAKRNAPWSDAPNEEPESVTDCCARPIDSDQAHTLAVRDVPLVERLRSSKGRRWVLNSLVAFMGTAGLLLAVLPALSTPTEAEPGALAVAAAEPEFIPAMRPIIEFRVGDAVLADQEHGDNDTSLGTQVDPQTWKHLVLKASKVDGSTA